MSDKQRQEPWYRFKTFWIVSSGVVTGIALGWGGYLGIMGWIDARIEQVVTSSDYVREIQRTLRPVLIFDENGTVIHDGGALDIIESIEVRHEPTEHTLPSGDTIQTAPAPPIAIVISSNRHLAIAPLLEPLDPERILMTAARQGMTGWRYDLDYESDFSSLTGQRRFRLEILY